MIRCWVSAHQYQTVAHLTFVAVLIATFTIGLCRHLTPLFN